MNGRVVCSQNKIERKTKLSDTLYVNQLEESSQDVVVREVSVVNIESSKCTFDVIAIWKWRSWSFDAGTKCDYVNVNGIVHVLQKWSR